MKGEFVMIDTKECQKRYKGNLLFKRSIDDELSKHGSVNCVCTSRFTNFMVKLGLGAEPITTEELLQLKDVL